MAFAQGIEKTYESAIGTMQTTSSQMNLFKIVSYFDGSDIETS